MSTHPLEQFAPPVDDTYPGGWFVAAVLAGLVALWLPGMVFVVFAAIVLGVRNVWREVSHRVHG